MSIQMLRTKIKSLGAAPSGDTEVALRIQLAGIEQPKQKAKPETEKTEKTEKPKKVEEPVKSDKPKTEGESDGSKKK